MLSKGYGGRVLRFSRGEEAGSCAFQGVRRQGPVLSLGEEAGSCAFTGVRRQGPVLLQG